MKLANVLGLAIAVAPIALAAQSSSQGTLIAQRTQIGPSGQTKTFTLTLPNPCPVGVIAQHRADGSMVKTGSAHPQGLGQWLHVTLTSPDTRILAKAAFNVHGWTAQGHMEQANVSRDGSQAVRTVQTPLTAESGGTASADLWAPGLTAVSSIELLSVDFADGSAWTPAPGKTCRVMPDPLMAIAR